MNIYDTERWKRKREVILKRDGYRCKLCARYGLIRDAVEVHHIKHYDEFPELAFTDSNLISLCKACHNKQHAEKGRHNYYKRGNLYD